MICADDRSKPYCFKALIAKDAQDLQKKLKVAWKYYLVKQISDEKTIAEAVGGIIADHPDYLAMKDEERKMLLSPPGSDTAFSHIENYHQKYRNLIESLGLSEKVSSFISQLNRQKAVPIEDIDADCLEQLQKSEFAGKLQIIIKD